MQLTSGGAEIFSLIHSRHGEQRTPLPLSQLSVGRQVVDCEAYCLLHLFATGLSAPPWPSDLTPEEIAQLLSSARDSPSIDRPKAKLQDSDWPLVQALADDGRAPYRQLAAAHALARVDRPTASRGTHGRRRPLLRLGPRQRRLKMHATNAPPQP